MNTRTFTASTMILAAIGLAGSAPAATIITQSGASERHLAFEAESFDSLGIDSNSATTWQVIADATASGGQALTATGSAQTSGDGEDGSGNDATATFRLVFLNDGPSGDPYELYIRRRAIGFGNSMYRPADFNVDPTGNSFNQHDNSVGADLPYTWLKSGSYEVAAGQLGVELTFSIKVREVGYVVDRIILSRDSSLNDSALDGIANSTVIPEPGSLALVGLGLTVFARRRR